MTEQATENGQDDLAILHPEHTLTLAGEPITVREYGHVEGLKLGHLVGPVVKALKGIALGGDLLDVDATGSAFAAVPDEVIALIAAACDKPVAWVENLNDEDGFALRMHWWAINSPFFGRRVLQSVVWDREVARQQQASAGPTSMRASSAAASRSPISTVSPAVN